MTEVLNIPIWLITLFVPLLLSIIILIISNVKFIARTNGEFRTSISDISNRLDRVETKLDAFIFKKLDNGK